MKHIILKTSAMALLLCMAVPATAEERASEPDSTVIELKAKVAELEKQVTKLMKDTTAKGKTIESLRRSLEKQAKGKDQKSVDELNERIKALCMDTTDLKRQQRDMERQLTAAQATADAKEKELAQLRPFRKMKLEQMLADAKAWATLPFSELDPAQMDALLKDCQEYGSGDKGIAETAKQVQQLRTELKQYADAMDLLKQPYNEPKKNTARKNLEQLMKKYAGKPQLPELKNVDELLRNYRGNVLLFQQLIADVDNEIKNQRENGNKNGAIQMLDVLLEDEEQKESIESIKTVPYLCQLLEQYLKDLKANPLEHSSVEDEVNNMLPK